MSTQSRVAMTSMPRRLHTPRKNLRRANAGTDDTSFCIPVTPTASTTASASRVTRSPDGFWHITEVARPLLSTARSTTV